MSTKLALLVFSPKCLSLPNYDEILRVAGSLQLGYVTASLFISKLQARPQQNMLTRVLQEYGKLEKLFLSYATSKIRSFAE